MLIPRCWIAGAVVASVAGACAPAEPTASDILDRAIAYHDPDGQWPAFAGTLLLHEIRPDGGSRDTRVSLDVARNDFVYELAGDEPVVKHVTGEQCAYSVAGSTRVPAEDEGRLGLSCDVMRRARNYYLYLWGLPMKLRDPGTRLHPAFERTSFRERDVLQLRVTYDEAVGSDTWYFYVDPDTYALAGYRFYHNESVNDGEYIVLDGEYAIGAMRIPERRTWYRNDNDLDLGADVLVGHEMAGPASPPGW